MQDLTLERDAKNNELALLEQELVRAQKAALENRIANAHNHEQENTEPLQQENEQLKIQVDQLKFLLASERSESRTQQSLAAISVKGVVCLFRKYCCRY